MSDEADAPALLPDRRRDAIALLIIFALITLVFADVLFLGNQFAFRDLMRYYFPAKHVIREVILGGEIPYWNRFFAAGQPLAANPEFEAFYPLQWLILLPDYELGFRLHILVHFYIAAAGMYLFMRSRRRSIASSAMTALTFVLAGYFLSLISLLPILFVIAWVPWVLLFVRRFLRKHRSQDFALAAILIGFQCLVGEPVSLVMSSILAGLYALFEAWEQKRSAAAVIRGGALAVAITISGVLVGMVQLLPAVDHLHDSVRSRGLDYREVTQWSMPLARPLELVAPRAFGSPGFHSYWGGSLYPIRQAPFYLTIYFGLIGIVLALAAIFARLRGSLAVAALAVTGYLLAIGSNGWLHGILYDAGIGQFVRYPEKFILLLLVPLTILAGDAFDALLDGNRRVRATAVAIAGLIATAAAAFLIFANSAGFAGWFTRTWSTSRDFAAAAPFVRADVTMLLAKAVILGVLMAFASRLRRPLFLAAVTIFWLVDVLPLSVEYLPRYPARFFEASPAVRPLAKFLRGDRLFHEGDFWAQHNRPSGYEATPAREWMTRNALAPMLPARWGIAMALELDFDRTALLASDEFSRIFAESMHEQRRSAAELMMAMSNVRARAVYRDPRGQRAAIDADPTAVTPISAFPTASNPRYYFADALVHVGDARDFQQKVWNGTWSRGTAFVQFKPFAPGAGRALAVRETANTASIDVEAQRPALLVASVTSHKYWTATIDGIATAIEPVNLAYQGVIVPAGRHRVSFRYRNTRVVAGGVVSLMSVALLIAMAIPWRRRSASHDVERDGNDHE